MARLYTRLQAEGAEFLVLGQLLLRGIPAYKAYTYMQGYDLVAAVAEANRVARIQVKSRFHTGASGFYISNFDAEFVVAAFLNRGRTYNPSDVKEPDFYIFPIRTIKKYIAEGKRMKFFLRHVPNVQRYHNDWGRIAKFLKLAVLK